MSKVTAIQKLESLMSDNKFHTNVELCDTVGWRFGGTLHHMRKKGYVFEKDKAQPGDKPYIEYWKMVKTPSGEFTDGEEHPQKSLFRKVSDFLGL